MNEIITKDASGALQKIYTPPAGEVMLFAGDTVPDGWMPCAGALVSRSAYPELFAAIGTKYGAGDGSTTFALPDTADRFPRFAGTLDVGMTQEDAIRNISGSFNVDVTNGSASYVNRMVGAFKYLSAASEGGIYVVNIASCHVERLEYGVAFNSSWVVPTAAENRPKAIAFKACIKY
ncbi:phage tail protein [Cloacibacillus evryensis]|uniref:phage tail protein n=1 Tax=Cloacibacillus evryensis TaxID=508460 RepID=UPI00241F7FAD|nr:phage tail protein [Cloacibacillus evryensis]